MFSHIIYSYKAVFRIKMLLSNDNQISYVPVFNNKCHKKKQLKILLIRFLILSFILLLIIMLNLTSFVNLKNLDTALYTDKIIRLIKLNAKLMHAVLQLT